MDNNKNEANTDISLEVNMKNNENVNSITIEIDANVSLAEKKIDKLIEKANQLKSTLLSVTEIINSVDKSEEIYFSKKDTAAINTVDAIAKKYEKEMECSELDIDQKFSILNDLFCSLIKNLNDI